MADPNPVPEGIEKPSRAKKQATYKVLYKVHHDDKIYRPGSTIALLDEHAEPLLARKVIEKSK